MFIRENFAKMISMGMEFSDTKMEMFLKVNLNLEKNKGVGNFKAVTDICKQDNGMMTNFKFEFYNITGKDKQSWILQAYLSQRNKLIHRIPNFIFKIRIESDLNVLLREYV